jgi:hypothetical protein
MRSPRLALTAAALLTTAATVRADPDPAPIAVFDKVTLENLGGAVYARRGPLVARIANGQFSEAPVIDAKGRKVSFATSNYCDAPVGTFTLTFDQLASRLDNVAAYGLHKKKKYEESKAGFARALALDPTNRIAAVNLASAQQLLGDKDGAVKTLTPWLASEPVAMYGTVVADPELAPLLPQPALAALKAKVPGNVTVTPGLLKGNVAYAAERALLAVQRTECGWGADGPDACAVTVELFDAAGTLTASLPLTSFDATNRVLGVRRARAAQQTLRDLGFKTEAVVTGKDTSTPADQDAMKRRISFPTLKVGVAVVEGHVNFLRGNTVLGHADTLSRLHGVMWAPSARAFVLWSGRPGHEGCEGTDPQETTVVPVALP